jgi:hypothetical protein
LTEGKFVGVIGSKKVRNIAITIHRLTLPRTQLAWTEVVHGGSLAGFFIDFMPFYFKINTINSNICGNKTTQWEENKISNLLVLLGN